MADPRGAPIGPREASPAVRVRRQVAVRLLPFLFILYIVNYLDRTSVAYAALGMTRDLGFSDRVFGFGTGVFFISYLALQIPGAMLVELWSARKMISGTMMIWGALTALTGLIHTAGQLYAARFVLGAAEAGFFPGVIVYLSHWFIREDRAKATSNFMAAIPLSFVIGSPIAGWILGQAWFGLAGWRWLFVLEGMPAILLGIAAFFYLADWPREANWLAPETRGWLEEKLNAEKPSARQKFSAWQALASRSVLIMAVATFFNYAAGYCLYFWLPILLKRGYRLTDFRVGLLGAVPYAAAFLVMQLNGWHSDKTGERHWHAASMMFIGAAGWLGLLCGPHSIALAIVFFSMMGIATAYLPVFWAIPTEILSESAAAASVGMINAVGSAAGFVGPTFFGYLNTRTGSFSSGLAMSMVCALVGGYLILCTPRDGRTL